MKAVFHTGVQVAWGDVLGGHPWCLAPAGGKPLVEYWLEWAAELGACDVRLVMGDGAEEVESFCGDGSRWGLQITYGFLKESAAPEAFLRRAPAQWDEGLLYVAAPIFPRRKSGAPPADGPCGTPVLAHRAWLFRQQSGRGAGCFLSRDGASIRAFIEGAPFDDGGDWSELGVEPLELSDLGAYYALNMRLVQGEIGRYVPPGFGGGDNAFIGSNVIIPPSVELRPPLIVGNDCRISPMAVIGPNAVIGNRVIVDSQTVLADSVVLDDTYLGKNLEVTGRVVGGARLIDPSDGTVVDIADPWLLAHLEASISFGDCVRAVGGWLVAAVLAVLQVVPFFLVYALLLTFGTGTYRLSNRMVTRARVQRLPLWCPADENAPLNRVFTCLSLDLFPLFVLAVLGRLWLCGHSPLHPEREAELRLRLRRYYPAVIGYHSLRSGSGDLPAEAAEILYYERYRSPAEDVRILVRALLGRLLTRLSCAPSDRP